MPVPKPRCFVCDKVIDDWDPQRGQHPKYCGLVCKEKGRADPRCGRCKQAMKPEPGRKRLHSATRYHESCRYGCLVCGESLRARAVSEMKEKQAAHLQPQYCSVKCQEHAWEGTPLPICFYCKKVVPLPRPPRALRNPPKAHHACRPNAARDNARQVQAKLEAEAARKAREKKPEPKKPKVDTRPNPFED